MKSLFLWAALAVVPFGATAVSVNNAGCPDCDCCGCCDTGECKCKACTCECCVDGCDRASATLACCKSNQ